MQKKKKTFTSRSKHSLSKRRSSLLFSSQAGAIAIAQFAIGSQPVVIINFASKKLEEAEFMDLGGR